MCFRTGFIPIGNVISLAVLLVIGGYMYDREKAQEIASGIFSGVLPTLEEKIPQSKPFVEVGQSVLGIERAEEQTSATSAPSESDTGVGEEDPMSSEEPESNESSSSSEGAVLERFTYPDSVGSSTEFETSTSAREVTSWYEDQFEAERARNTSFVKTSSNGVVNNQLAGQLSGGVLSVHITTSGADSPTQVELSWKPHN